MKRAAKLLLILLLVGAVLAGLGWGGIMLAERRATLLTDGSSIRTLLRDEEPREIMWTPPERLSTPINSPGDDYEPRISADGQTLLFVRGKAGRNADIHQSTKTPGGWSAPVPIGAVNSDADDLGPELAPDGSALYFYSNRTGGFGGYDLWVARRGDAGEWGAPVNLGANVNSDHHDYGPALSPGGTQLYFASNRPKPAEPVDPNADAWSATVREDLFKRDYDLYLAEMTSGEPGAARPLTEINTPANEGTPSVSPSGDFLHFASDREGGEGGFDLYRSRRLDGGHWPAVNLGPSINTRANELDPAPSMGGFALHFSSDRPREVLVESAEPLAPNYDLFFSQSREVYRTIDQRELDVDWAGLWALIGPWLLWLLLLLLLLLLALLALRDGRVRDRWGKLGLLARCILLSLLLHALLLAMLAAWEVSTALGEYFRNPGGTKVALMSRSSGDGIASQIRGQVTSFELEFAPATDSIRREAEPVRPARAESAQLELTPLSLPDAARLNQETQAQDAEAPDSDVRREVAEAQEIDQAQQSSVQTPQVAPAQQRAEAQLAVETADAPNPEQNQRAIEVQSTQAAQAAMQPDRDLTPPARQFRQITRAQDAIADNQSPVAPSLSAPAPTPDLQAPQSSLSTPESSARAVQNEQAIATPSEQIQRSARATSRDAQSERARASQASIAPNDLSRQPDPGPLADQSELSDAAAGLVPSPLAGGAPRRIDLPPTVAQGDVPMPAGSPGASRDEGALTMPRAAPVQASRPQRAAPSPSSSAARAEVNPADQPFTPAQSAASQLAQATDASSSSAAESAPSSSSAADLAINSVLPSISAMPEAREFDFAEPDRDAPMAQFESGGPRAAPSSSASQSSSSSSAARLDPATSDADNTAASTLAQSAPAREAQSTSESAAPSGADVSVELAQLVAPAIALPTSQQTSEQAEQAAYLPQAALRADRLAQQSATDSLTAPRAANQARVAPDSSSSNAARDDASLTGDSSRLTGEADAHEAPAASQGQLAIDPGAVRAGDVSLPGAPSTAWSDEETAAEPGLSTELDSARAQLDASSLVEPSSSALASIAPAPEALGGSSSVMDPGAENLILDSQAPIDTSSDVSQLPLPGAPALALAMPDFTLPEAPDHELYPQRAPEIREQLVEQGGGNEDTEEAVQAALVWLAAQQGDNGAWTGIDIPDEAGGDSARFELDTALTGLSLLCFMGAGHTHLEEGPYQETVRAGLEWLANQVSASGDLRTGETLYSQGIGTIALAEAFGMTRDPRVRELAERAVLFIARSRHTGERGGWRYEPGQEGDTSVLGWQVMAMISARRAGLDVPDDTLEAAGDWLGWVTQADQPGLYAYKPGRRPTVSMTAEAIYIRQILGESRDAEGMAEGVSYVLRSLPDWDDEPSTYYWYYATLAMFQHSGPAWARWNEAMVRELIEHQRADGAAAGSWDITDRWGEIGGRVYQTAICALMLEVYYRYLPLYVIERADAAEAGDSP